MVDRSNPRLPIELPKEFLSQLDPMLRELYSKLPVGLAARVAVLVREALPQGIPADRVLKFAFLYATAERRAQGDAVSKEHTRRSKLELAGEIHGMQTGYRDDEEALRRYRRGRRARQQIKASLDALLPKWRTFKDVVRKHRPELPVHIQSKVSDSILGEVGKALQTMGIAIVLDEEDLSIEKSGERERSVIAQTYIWWLGKMAPYRGKWNDMHQVAYAWSMTSVASLRSFRTLVGRICKGATCTELFEKPWESVLSGKA
jgi:hypothetical protein